MLPDLDSLRCFEAAATHLNFRSAARQVALSPGAFSDRIKRLEELLGERLFDRTTRSVALTEAGRRLLPEARRCIEAARRCAAAVREGETGPPFELTVGTRYELGMSWLVPALADLRAARPDRTVHLYFGDGPDLLRRTERGELDAFVASIRLTAADLEYAVLHPEAYAFVAAPALLDAQPLSAPADAAHHVLIDTHRDLPLFRYFLDARPADEDWVFGGREYLGTIAAVRYRVREGAGVAVLPLYFVRDDLAAGALVEVAPSPALGSDRFRLVWRRAHPLAAEMRHLAAALVERPLR